MTPRDAMAESYEAVELFGRPACAAPARGCAEPRAWKIGPNSPAKAPVGAPTLTLHRLKAPVGAPTCKGWRINEICRFGHVPAPHFSFAGQLQHQKPEGIRLPPLGKRPASVGREADRAALCAVPVRASIAPRYLGAVWRGTPAPRCRPWAEISRPQPLEKDGDTNEKRIRNLPAPE